MTLTKSQKMVALTVLTRIKAHDPSFYTANEPMVEAWASLLAGTTLTQADLVEAVDQWFRQPHERHPRAADILTIAKASWRDRFEREDDDGPLHRELYAIADAKAAPDAPALDQGTTSAKLDALKGRAWQTHAEHRKAAVDKFQFRPRPGGDPVTCRLCGAELVGVQTSGSGGVLLAHPDGGPGTCPAERDELARAQQLVAQLAEQADKLAQLPSAQADRTPEDPT